MHPHASGKSLTIRRLIFRCSLHLKARKVLYVAPNLPLEVSSVRPQGVFSVLYVSHSEQT